MNYIIGVKPGDHTYLFDWIKNLTPTTHTQEDDNGTAHEFRFYKDVPLNDEHHHYQVHVLDYYETNRSGKQQHFTWITKLPITKDNAYQIMRAGRSRWRIENETFNTLKNQGYNFEHNYGHGYKNLCSVMTMLMMLAFLVDQVQALCCNVYQKARARLGPLSVLFEEIRVLIKYGVWESWHDLYRFLGLPPEERPPPGERGGFAYNG